MPIMFKAVLIMHRVKDEIDVNAFTGKNLNIMWLIPVANPLNKEVSIANIAVPPINSNDILKNKEMPLNQSNTLNRTYCKK
jgi:hypothetical protein